MAVDPIKIASSLYAGTFDPHNSAELKALNDAHEKMTPGSQDTEIRKTAVIIYRSDLPLDDPEALRALNLARTTLGLEQQIVGGALGAMETVPEMIKDTYQLATDSQTQRAFVHGLESLALHPQQTIRHAVRESLAQVYESDNPGTEMGKLHGHMLANLALGAAGSKTILQRFTSGEIAAETIKPGTVSKAGMVTTYEEVPFTLRSKNAPATPPRLITRTDLGEGYSVHVSDNVGQGYKVQLEITKSYEAGRHHTVRVEVPPEIWHEHNFLVDMRKTINKLEQRLSHKPELKVELSEMRSAKQHMESTYQDAINAAMPMQDNSLQTMVRYSLFKALKQEFKFPEEHVTSVNLSGKSTTYSAPDMSP